MQHSHRLVAAAVAAALLVALAPGSGRADDWFMPGGQGGAAHTGRARAPAVRPSNLPPPMPAVPPAIGPAAEPQPAAPEVQVQLPPMPELPPIPKGVEPPTPRIGVLGVPDVMRVSTAAQEVERVLGGRRQKLNEDAQKEQAAWRDLQQQLVNMREQRGVSAEQIRTKERELQERITNAQRTFRERDRVIQEAARYSLSQIERVLVAVIRQVAESRGMNLVLHRQQVALNANEFDLTDQVAAQLNKVLPSVIIPPDGVSPAAMAQNGGKGPASAPAHTSGGKPSATRH